VRRAGPFYARCLLCTRPWTLFRARLCVDSFGLLKSSFTARRLLSESAVLLQHDTTIAHGSDCTDLARLVHPLTLDVLFPATLVLRHYVQGLITVLKYISP
jgi:hypothetical protein